MLASERQHHLLQLIERQEVVRTLDLADLYQVSAETIRRDFLLLEQAGKIRRIHGGAQSLSTRHQLQSFSQRENIQTEQKRAIARTALQLIHADSIYGFDSSTTALALVSQLPDLAYRAITNSHRVLEHLTHYHQVELISTGGRYQSKTQTYVGGDSINTLRHHNINISFLSCVGFDLQRGASESFEQQATFKERLVEYSEKIVLLIDSSKFEQQSEYFFAEPKKIHQIITDSAIEPTIAQAIQERGIDLIIADS